jgi:protein TonB
VRGLSVVFVPVIDPPPISATNSPMPVDPPSQPAKPTRTTHETQASNETITTIPLGPIGPVRLDPMPLPSGVGTGDGAGGEVLIRDPVPTQPPPEPLPLRAPRPLGQPGLWVTPADYPTMDLRLGHAGRVGFTLDVGANGKVTSCTVTASSGFPGLDQAACQLLTRRARFQPGADAAGQPAPGTYAGAVRWEIPAD